MSRDTIMLPFSRRLKALGFARYDSMRDPLLYRNEPEPLPDDLRAMPQCFAYCTESTHMRVNVQLWRDGRHRLSHELGDGVNRWRSDSLPTYFATPDEMAAAIEHQVEFRRRLWNGRDDGQAYPDIKAIMAGKPTPSELGFVDSASTPVTAMRRSIHRSHRGGGHNFVD